MRFGLKYFKMKNKKNTSKRESWIKKNTGWLKDLIIAAKALFELIKMLL